MDRRDEEVMTKLMKLVSGKLMLLFGLNLSKKLYVKHFYDEDED